MSDSSIKSRSTATSLDQVTHVRTLDQITHVRSLDQISHVRSLDQISHFRSPYPFQTRIWTINSRFNQLWTKAILTWRAKSCIVKVNIAIIRRAPFLFTLAPFARLRCVIFCDIMRAIFLPCVPILLLIICVPLHTHTHTHPLLSPSNHRRSNKSRSD